MNSFLNIGLRTIALAYRNFSEEPDWGDEDDVISELTFVALVGIKVLL